MDAATLDAWLPEFAVRTRHGRRSSATPARLWAAANEIRMSETHSLGRLVRWRIPGVRTEETFGELLAAYPFCVLDEGEHWSISGLCGRIWTFQRDYPLVNSAGALFRVRLGRRLTVDDRWRQKGAERRHCGEAGE